MWIYVNTCGYVNSYPVDIYSYGSSLPLSQSVPKDRQDWLFFLTQLFYFTNLEPRNPPFKTDSEQEQEKVISSSLKWRKT